MSNFSLWVVDIAGTKNFGKFKMWPKGVTYWQEGRTLCASIPFTWNLPEVKYKAQQLDMFSCFDRVEVGGQAVQLIPGFFDGVDNVVKGQPREGVLQRINPMATRTTLGCTRSCWFCAIGTGRVEGGGIIELERWLNLPIKCDNNIFAASDHHIYRSLKEDIERGYVDYNQGLDARYLTKPIAEMISEIRKPLIRLSCDSMAVFDKWLEAVELLKECGVLKSNIAAYVLVGFKTPPEEAWKRAEMVNEHVGRINIMWYHKLDSLVCNTVTEEQSGWGWTERDRVQINDWYYCHRGSKPKYLTKTA